MQLPISVTFTASALFVLPLLVGVVLLVFSLMYLIKRSFRQGKKGFTLSSPMSLLDPDSPRARDDKLLELPARSRERLYPDRADILDVPAGRQTVTPYSENSVIDVTGQSRPIPAASGNGLTKYEPGAPFWTHHYLYSAAELEGATQAQKAFYYLFRKRFTEGIYLDLEGNTNYAFILLFDLVDSYAVNRNLSATEHHLTKLGELYPKTAPYVRSAMFRKMAELGDHTGMDRYRVIGRVGGSEYSYGFYDPEYWRLGSRNKDRLNLSKEEVGFLNNLPYASNAFLDIEFCQDQVIRTYLFTVNAFSKAVTDEGSSLDSLFRALSDLIARKQYRYRSGSANYRWHMEYASNELYALLFKLCENAVRQAYGHKRKLNLELFSAEAVKLEINEKLISKVEPFIRAALNSIPPPDMATEVELNRQNTTRWKAVLQKLNTQGLNAEEYMEEVLALGECNKKNPSVENIFFDASKFAAKLDKTTSLALYVYYLHHDLRSKKFDNRKLTKTIQKSLFSNNEQLHKFQKLISEFITDRDLEKALAAVPSIYIKERRRISLDSTAVLEARNKHSDTVDLLNEYLEDHFEDEENSLDATEINQDEVQLKITSKSDLGEQFASPTVDLTPIQSDLLQLFAKGGFTLSQQEVEIFAKDRGKFRNQLIESMNDCCFDILGDLLIEEEDDDYTMNSQYYSTIIPDDGQY